MNSPDLPELLRAAPVVVVDDLSETTISGVETFARTLGYECVRIDLADCDDKAALLARTAAALRFPEWFGHNWDAWFDCLTDLGWRDAAAGRVLVFERAARLRSATPEVFDTALAILEDVARVWSGRGVALRAIVGLA